MDAPPFPVPDDDSWHHALPLGEPVTLTLTYVPTPRSSDFTVWLPAWMRLLDVGTAVTMVVGTQTFPCRIVARQAEQDGYRYAVLLDERGARQRGTEC